MSSVMAIATTASLKNMRRSNPRSVLRIAPATPTVYLARVVIVLVVVGALVLVPFVFYGIVYTMIGPVVDRRRRVQDDRMVFDYYCSKGVLHRFMRINRRVPSDPRCKLCYVPFGGLGRLFGVRPSRRNSNFCRACFETVPVGGHEREIGVFFADLRGFTAWSGEQTPERVAGAAADFYEIAARRADGA